MRVVEAAPDLLARRRVERHRRESAPSPCAPARGSACRRCARAVRSRRRSARRRRRRASRPRARPRWPGAGRRVVAASPISDVRTTSWRTSLISIPSAEKWPGAVGTITSGTFSSAASRAPCSGPPPPQATSAKSRGSRPRRMETSRSRLTMLALAMRRMPRAVPSSEVPSAVAETLDRGARELLVERHPAAHEGDGADATGDEVRVRQRRLRAAAAVARGPGIGDRATAGRPSASPRRRSRRWSCRPCRSR